MWGRGEIFYLDGNLRLHSAAYAVSGDSLRPGAVRRWAGVRVNGLIGERNYDVMPDGKHIIGLLVDDSEADSKMPGTISVVLNFYDELVRRFGKH